MTAADAYAVLHVIKENARVSQDMRLLGQLAALDAFHRRDTHGSLEAARNEALAAYGLSEDLIKRVKQFAVDTVRACDTHEAHVAEQFKVNLYSAYLIDNLYTGCYGQDPHGFDVVDVLRSFTSDPKIDGHGYVTNVGTWQDLAPRRFFMRARSREDARYVSALFGLMVVNFVLGRSLGESLQVQEEDDDEDEERAAYHKLREATELASLFRAGYLLHEFDAPRRAKEQTVDQVISFGHSAIEAAALQPRRPGGMTLVDALGAYDGLDSDVTKAMKIARKLRATSPSSAKYMVGMSLMHQLMRIHSGPLKSALITM